MSRRLPTLALICFTAMAYTGASASIKIAGRVLVPGDAPLAEAEVTLTPLTDALTELQARESGRAEPDPIRALTDAAGRYEIAAPYPGMWRVEIAAAGCAPLQAVLRPLIEPTVLDDAVLLPDVGLTVRVSDPQGRPVEGASVIVVVDQGPMGFRDPPWQSPRRRGVTAEDGSVRLAHAERDAVKISVAAAGHPVGELQGRRGTAAQRTRYGRIDRQKEEGQPRSQGGTSRDVFSPRGSFAFHRPIRHGGRPRGPSGRRVPLGAGSGRGASGRRGDGPRSQGPFGRSLSHG